MKLFRRWFLRIVLFFLLLLVSLLVLILNPSLLYAHETTIGQFHIYHSKKLSDKFPVILDQAKRSIAHSSYYHPETFYDICLNDGSWYPNIIAIFGAPAFAWGFYDKVVLQGDMIANANRVALNGYQWNLSELLAHELTHCMQFQHLGWRHANPMAGIPEWKWEGYAEYVARRADLNTLKKNWLLYTSSNKDSWGISREDGSIIPRAYAHHLLLTQYVMQVEQQSFDFLLRDTRSEEEVEQALFAWLQQP